MKIAIETLEFPLCVKEKLLKIHKILKLHIEFVSGKTFILRRSILQLMNLFPLVE